MNAASSIRKSPNSSGDAPGLRFTWLVTRALEHTLSDGSIVVIFSTTPYVSANAPAGFTPVIAAPDHFPWIETKQDPMEVVSVTARECPRQHHDPVDTGGKRSESIALSRISGQLVHFIADAVIKPVRHIAADEFQWSHPPDLISIRLPKWAVEASAGLDIR